jgi:diadenosine tetraphosphate (Ap4A) HIT family hydrolase
MALEPQQSDQEPLFFFDERSARATTQKEGCIFCAFYDPSINRVVMNGRLMYVRWDNFPAAEGHVEIVPKRHVESFFDLTDPEMREMRTLMAEVKEILKERYKPGGYTIGINEGNAAGRSVHHLHIHMIPRHLGDVENPEGGIRRIFPDFDPGMW